MPKKLPKTIFVRYEGEDKEQYLSAFPDINPHVNIGETTQVGVYTLSRVVKASGEINIKSAK